MACNCQGGPGCCMRRCQDAALRFILDEEAWGDDTHMVPSPPAMPEEGVVSVVLYGLSPDMNEER